MHQHIQNRDFVIKKLYNIYQQYIDDHYIEVSNFFNKCHEKR